MTDVIKMIKANAQYKSIFVVTLMLILILIVMSIAVPTFGTVENIGNVLVQFVPLAIASLGQTFVMISGGIDLSIGVMISATTTLAAITMNPDRIGVVPGLFLVILLGIAVGLFNGVGVSVLDVPPLITTLSSMTILQGVTFAFLRSPGGAIDRNLSLFVMMRRGLLSMPMLILILTFLVLRFVLYNTRFGLHVYAVGENQKIASSAGINVKKTLLGAYITTSLCGVIAGFVLACRIRSGDPIIGTPFGLDSITAAVIGGTAITGGVGFLAGSIVGALIIGFLSNIMNSLGVSAFWQFILKGLLLILTMVIYTVINQTGRKEE
jgi:ribose/xylose/arabinose/galactoside ABC-type transport system permease subunit